MNPVPNSSYAVSVDREESSKEPEQAEKQVDQLATIHDYIQEFDHTFTVPSKNLFPSYMACHMSTLFGMKEFGGGEHYQQGIQNWKYFCVHVVMICMFSPGIYSALYCAGVRSWVAAVIATVANPPMMVVSMLAEVKIFRSQFLAAALLRGGDDVKAMSKNGGGVFVNFMVMMLVQIVITLVLPFFLLVRPYTQVVPSDVYVEYLMWGVLGLIVVTLPFLFSFGSFGPLVLLHNKETLLAVEKTTKALDILLFHPKASLTAAQTRKELSAITNKLINPLEYELNIMSHETIGMCVACIPAMVSALYLLFGTFGNNKMGDTGTGFRIAIAILVLIFCLLLPATFGNPGKIHAHWRRLSRKLNDAENVSRAAAVFDGDFNAFLEWFRRNEISAKFMGTPIDDQLPGKILALFASIVGAVALVIARISGWY